MKEALIELFPFKHGMNWMTVDSDGTVWQFSKEPVQNKDTEEWDIVDFSSEYQCVGSVSPPQDWTTTLVKREEWKLSDEQVEHLKAFVEGYVGNKGGLPYVTREGILKTIALYESFKSKA